MTTILKWTASCQECRESMTGRDTIESGKDLVREYGHDNPAFTLVFDRNAHQGQPAEDTIRVIDTVSC